MRGGPTLPAELICLIAGKIIQAEGDWSEQARAFALQSMSLVNKHWKGSTCSLSSRDFPKANPMDWFKDQMGAQQ
jgi:hypothetical protein